MWKYVTALTERTRFVKLVLPLLALWLQECHSAAQIQGQDKLSSVRPCKVGSRGRDAVAGIYESRSLRVKATSTTGNSAQPAPLGYATVMHPGSECEEERRQ